VASAELRQTRRRIKSVQSTKKITRAMELIAASRIVTAQQRVDASKPYVWHLTDVIRKASRAAGGARHMLLERRPLSTAGIVVVSSDRGLAGAYNSTVIRLAEKRVIELRAEGVDARLYVVGKKAHTYFRFRGYHVERAFVGMTDSPGYSDARAVANAIMEAYAVGDVDMVEVFYTRYRSALIQEETTIGLLPIMPPTPSEGDAIETIDYSYEPSPAEILDRILPRYVEATLFGVLLDSSASEHASRQRAMKAATDNAEELIKVLSRKANQARQAEITTEISEIVGGAEALREG
jgi:F-type H+-transporting ATPase subunit gamma